MQSFKFSKGDIKYHFENNKAIYFMFFLCFVIGVVIGIVIALSKVSYLGLLNIKNKLVISIISGKVSVMAQFWDALVSFLVPLALMLLLSLNFYVGLLNFLFVGYQSIILTLTCFAMVASYEMAGFLKMLLIILPINICYFLIIIFWAAACYARSKSALKNQKFLTGFDYGFITKLYLTIGASLALALVAGIVVPLLLKSAIFLIF